MNLAQLRNHLLKYIGVIGVGNAASSEDAELAETVLTNTHAELEQLGVALWTTDDVPEYAIEGICIYSAPTLAGYHGKADEFPLQGKLVGLAMLRELTADGRTSVGRANYF